MSQKARPEFEDSWVYDSLVGFLRGPVWHVPVMTFIEQKSLSKADFRHLLNYLQITKKISRTTVNAEMS